MTWIQENGAIVLVTALISAIVSALVSWVREEWIDRARLDVRAHEAFPIGPAGPIADQPHVYVKALNRSKRRAVQVTNISLHGEQGQVYVLGDDLPRVIAPDREHEWAIPVSPKDHNRETCESIIVERAGGRKYAATYNEDVAPIGVLSRATND